VDGACSTAEAIWHPLNFIGGRGGFL